MEHRKKILGTGLLLLFVALGSHALTLGRASGSALIGRPLDMVIPVQMDAGESAASLCFEAEVFHADSRQDPSRVQVLIAPAAQPNMLNVRVVSAAAVDEPVVTVYLRTGCGQKTTRRYVLLADFPSEVAAPALPLVAAPTVQPKGSASALTAKVAEAPSSAPVVAAGRADATQAGKASTSQNSASRREPKKAVVTPAKAAANASLSPVQRSAGQPRLQLDPLELLSDRMSSLDGNMTFDAPPDALESIQKIKSLEDSLKSLRLLASKNETSLNDMQARLQQAQASGFSSQTGYALMALALVCLAAAAVVTVLWRRQRQAHVTHAWWADADAVPQAPAVKKAVDTVPATLATSPVVSQWPAPAQTHAHPVSGFGSSEGKPSGFGVDVNLTDMTDSAFRDFMPTGTKSGNGSSVADLHSAGVPAVQSARNLNSDAVLDIRQQAEFFVSLGQTERAAQLLRREIKESHEPNPFVYLDLLALFHSLGLKGEFQQLRESFELLFCCRIPAFTFFKNRSLDLESYPDVLSHIVGIWSEPGVLAWLESCIFQNPDKGGSLGFDLAAFRDLLFLHAVARILADTPESEGGASPKAVRSVASVRAQPTPLLHELVPFDALDLDLSISGGAGVKASTPASSLDEPLSFMMPPDLQFETKVKRS